MNSEPNFNIFNTIILAGILQGFIFGIVVLSAKKYRAPATLFLVALILSFSLDNFQYYLEDIGIITETELMATWFIPFQLLSGPLFLLYGLYLLNPERHFKSWERLYFVPFLVALAISLSYKISFAADLLNPAAEEFYDYMEGTLEIVSIIFDTSVLVFLFFKTILYEKRLCGFRNEMVTMKLTWFKIVLVVMFLLSMLWIYVTIQDYIYNNEYWHFIYIGMAATVYWLGHIGIYKYGIREERQKIRDYAVEKKWAYSVPKAKNDHIRSLERILVEERKFLDPNMTLDKLADELHLSKSHLSRTINSELGTSFTDYINALRVEEAKSYLINPAFSNYTLVAIGLESGFNSKSAFNSVFKKITSFTPSEFRKSKQN